LHTTKAFYLATEYVGFAAFDSVTAHLYPTRNLARV